MEGNPNFPTSEANAPAVKFYASKAMAKKGDKIAVPVLIKTFQKESEKLVEHNPPKQRKISDGVADRHSNSSPYFYEDGEISMVLACGEILRALGSLPFSEASEGTIKQALAHPNFYIRSSAADAMFESKRKEFLPSLSEALRKRTNSLRQKLQFWRGLLGSKDFPIKILNLSPSSFPIRIQR